MDGGAADSAVVSRAGSGGDVEGDVCIVYPQRLGHSPNEHIDEAHGCAHGGCLQQRRADSRRHRGHRPRAQRLWGMGYGVAGHHRGRRQGDATVGYGTLVADDALLVGGAAVILRHRIAHDGHLISEHGVSEHILLFHRQPHGHGSARILHTSRQMEQDGHLLAVAGADIVISAGAVGSAGR